MAPQTQRPRPSTPHRTARPGGRVPSQGAPRLVRRPPTPRTSLGRHGALAAAWRPRRPLLPPCAAIQRPPRPPPPPGPAAPSRTARAASGRRGATPAWCPTPACPATSQKKWAAGLGRGLYNQEGSAGPYDGVKSSHGGPAANDPAPCTASPATLAAPRARPPAAPAPLAQRQACPRGDACPHAHSLYEYWLHPDRFRTEACQVRGRG
jgi:hypothetical protein